MLNCRRMINIMPSKTKWIKPPGYDTGINIYNCVAKEKVPLILKQEGVVTWYTCGPTVYDDAHIGHASCYLKIDIIQRILRYHFNYNLITAINITDIDDKIIKRCKEMKTTPDVLTRLYEQNFWSDLAKLGINKPNVILRVSENMSCIQDFIETLLTKNLAYQAENKAIYFKSREVPYGKLVNVKSNDGDESLDFALWKQSLPGEISWQSPWGPGRPGWHVECSALASQIFGSSVDIHAGGMDLKFPHHENEEAQSCGYHSCSQWVNYWLHVGQLQTKSSEKMSKSLKNTISISTLLQQTRPDDFRLACLMSHYRSKMDFSPELLKMASNTLKKYKNFLNNCCSYIMSNSNGGISVNEDPLRYLLLECRGNLHEALCDDFDTPEVINILNKIVKLTNPMLTSKSVSNVTVVGLQNFVQDTLLLFNIKCSEEIFAQESDESEILDILKDFRYSVRALGLQTENVKILELCDKLRSTLRDKGIDIKDLNVNKTM